MRGNSPHTAKKRNEEKNMSLEEQIYSIAILACENKPSEVYARMDELTGALEKLAITPQKATQSGFIMGLSEALAALSRKDMTGLGSALLFKVLADSWRIQSGITKKSGTEALLELWAAQFEKSAVRRAICFFGSPASLYLSELAKRFTTDSILFVFDPEGDEKLVDFRGELAANLNFYLLDGLVITCEPGMDVTYRDMYFEFVHEINSARERILVNKNTLARFKDSACANVITNLPMLKQCNLVTQLKSVISPNIPAIIVAAGPSLDKNIEELRRAKGHCLIFAVDTAMKYLMAKNIMPDIGITVEPIKPMANYEDERCFTIPHIFDCESNPQIVQKTTARKFIINCRDYTKRLFEAMGIEIPSDTAGGGSVATSAFAVCYQLGIKNIILIGQDLAYLGDATHAGNVESKGINNTVEYELVDGIMGDKVRTRGDWIGYLKWFENSINAINEMNIGIKVIDATEGGALIHGTTVMTLRDAVDTYTSGIDFDLSKALEKLPYLIEGSRCLELDRLIAKSFDQLEDVKTFVSEGLKACEEDDIDRVRIARHKCENAMMYPLINNYAVCEIADETAKLISECPGVEGELKQSRLAFDAIGKACDYFAKKRPKL